MPSIRDLTRLSVATFLGFHLLIEIVAYPIVEKDQDTEKIERRFLRKGGYSRPILGGALLGGGGILAYNHFKGSKTPTNTVIPSEPLTSNNGGPTDSPFLTDTQSKDGSSSVLDGTDPASSDLGTGAGAGVGAGAGAGAGAGVGVGAGAGAGVAGVGGTGVAAGAGGAGVAAGAGAAAIAADVGSGSGMAVSQAPAGAVPGAGERKDVLAKRRAPIGDGESALIPRAAVSSGLKTGIGSVGTIVTGTAVLNLVTGFFSGKKSSKAKAADKNVAEAEKPAIKSKEETLENVKTKTSTKSESKSQPNSSGRADDEEQTE